MFPFICADTEDNSKELCEARRRGEAVNFFRDKRVTQIAAITAAGEHYYNRGDVPAFLKWLERRVEKYVYFNNVQYDLGNLFGNALDCLDCTLVGGRMIKAVLGEKVFVDVYNLWQMSVKNLGNVFDLHKRETDSMSSDRDYAMRDVEIIREAMLYCWEFASNLGLSHVPPTLGSLGVMLWRHWGGENTRDTQTISRDGIYGGRVELFSTGMRKEQGIGYTDINSLYPFAMTKAFPGVCKDTGKKLKTFGVAQVTIKISECEIAPLPYRDPDGRILYPWGEFTGVWPIPEIREAVKHGAKITKVHNSYGTDEATYPYKTYVERIYKIRNESKSKVEKNFYKLLMNTLFGRLGNSGKIGRTVYLTERNKDEGTAYGIRNLISYEMPLSEEVNWLHCGHVTAYGRLELQRYLRTVGADRMIYCDTDSVIFDCPEAIPFETGSELGQMKIEQSCSACGGTWHPEKNPCPGATAQDRWNVVATYAPKQYQLGSYYKAKGVPKQHQKEFIEQGTAVYDMPFKFREAVSFYDRENAKRLSDWREIEKQNKSAYDKKILRGNRYFPCKINDI